MHFIVRIILTALALYLTVYAVPGIVVSGGWETFALVAVVWVALSLSVIPILKLVTLPITILTFGLFSFVLNALVFWALTLVIPGFYVQGFVAALLGSIVFSFLSWVVQKLA